MVVNFKYFEVKGRCASFVTRKESKYHFIARHFVMITQAEVPDFPIVVIIKTRR